MEFVWISYVAEVTEYRIAQIVDNGQIVQMSLVENVQTEPISQKQLIMESVSKKLDDETKKQVFLSLKLKRKPHHLI